MWGIWGLLCNFRFFPSLWALTEQCRQKTVYKFITEFSQVEYSASLFLVFKASSPCHTAQNSVNVHSIPSARTWCLEFTLTGLSLGKDLWRFCSSDDALIFQESAEALVNVAMRLKTWCVHLFNLIFWRLSLLFSLPLRKLSFYITSKSCLKERCGLQERRSPTLYTNLHCFLSKGWHPVPKQHPSLGHSARAHGVLRLMSDTFLPS